MMSRLRAFFNPPNPNPLRAPARIFWTGLIVRVLYMTLAHTYRMRVIDDHFEFGWEMGRIARALVTGRGFADPFNGLSGPTAWTPPLYPLLIAGVFKLFGVYTLLSSWVILAVNSVFSAATAPAIYQIGWRCFGGKDDSAKRGLSIALWSAWLWALYPAAMQYAVKWIWDMALTAFLFTWVLVLALKLRGIGERSQFSVVSSQNTAGRAPFAAEASQLTTENSQLRTWLLFGLLWGLVALSNSSLLSFLPFCGLWIIWPALRTRTNLLALLRGAVLSAICFLAVISPWTIRNWRVFHAFVPMRSNFGAELYESTIFSNDGFPWMATLPMAEDAPEFQRYERLGEIAYSREQGERAKAAIRAHPGLFLRNTLHRVYFFWISVPHPLDSGILVEAVRRLNFSFFSVTGILGLILALRRRIPGAWLFLWMFLITPLIYYVVTVQARFRHPIEPIICVLSVYLFQSADRTRAWSWKRSAQPN
ncbi:MAG TPA: hypothetical protein VG714_00950 [Acidobacteriaceae bacterium]|nr:hypothetical protein [Acidobacteriaceae bacterium]